MAGRGRGRGRGSFSFDAGALGFGKGEALPSAILQPPQLFPPLEFQTSPLSNTEVDEYLLALKQEFRAGMEDSQYFVKSSVKSNDIKRYSDKYKTSNNSKSESKIDNCLLPKELHVKVNTRKMRATASAPPIIHKRKRQRIDSDSGEETTVEVLEKVLEEKVIDDDEEVKEGDEVEEEEEYYEEDEEEENDYLVNHYDEGEDDFGMGDDDDADEGPVY